MHTPSNVDLLAYLSLLLLPGLTAGIKVLLLGDSVDRWIVYDYCTHLRQRGIEATSFEWGEGSIRYQTITGAQLPATLCHHGQSTIAFVHMYGSNATGPYFHNFKGSGLEPFIDTKPRIVKSLHLFNTSVGTPDLIIFNSAQWDVQYWYDFHHVLQVNETLWFSAVESFTRNLKARVGEILAWVGNQDVAVGLRTSVWEAKGGMLLTAFNEIQRKLASEMNLVLFDFDRDVWSTVSFNYTPGFEAFIFRDWIHPRTFYTLAAALKLVGEQFTTSISTKNKRLRELYFDSNSNSSKIVKLFRRNNTLYFAHDGKYFADPNPCFLESFRLGPYDVLELEQMPQPGEPLTLPSIFHRYAMYNVSFDNKIYLLTGGLLRRVPDSSVPGLRCMLNLSDPIFLVNNGSDIARWVSLITEGPALPNIYVDLGVFRIHGNREIFTFVKGTKRSISNMKVFVSLGKELSDIINVHAGPKGHQYEGILIRDFNEIPTGPPLEAFP